jgi:hypothetical protein
VAFRCGTVKVKMWQRISGGIISMGELSGGDIGEEVEDKMRVTTFAL